MKKLIALILVSFFFVSADLVRFHPPGPGDAPTKIKATFLYNFTKYIEWPEDYKQGNFVIGVMGNNTLYNDLNTFFSTKTLGTQKYEVKLFAKASDITRCHMIFIPADYTGSVNEVIAKVKGKSTLVVTDKAGMAKQGAAINFVSIDNKQKFELNKTNVEKSDLKVSSSLISLAIVVD
ncbi:MAG TPA: YfiR family protein [Bacteroidia bacterium]